MFKSAEQEKEEKKEKKKARKKDEPRQQEDVCFHFHPILFKYQYISVNIVLC